MLNPIKPFGFVRFDKEDGSGQDGGVQIDGQPTDGQNNEPDNNQGVSDLAEKAE